MKKFIGNVNGVEYTDKEAFNEAVKKAMENYNGTMVITSYEKDVPDEKEETPVLPEKKNIVDKLDFVIERESDKTNIDGRTYFVIPDEVTKKITNCDNRDEVAGWLRSYIDKWDMFLYDDEKALEKYEEDLKDLQIKIEQEKKDIEEDKAGIRYYKTLLGYLNGRKPICKDCDNYKTLEGKIDCSGLKRGIRESKEQAVDLINELSNVFENFGSYLRKKGFF